MGLDMYLSARYYMSEHSNADVFAAYSGLKIPGITLPPEYLAGGGCSIEIAVQVAYWRKANAIHAWFVREVQGGNDDCGHYDVDYGQLRGLRELCRTVVAARDEATAKANLPTQSGFFFGGTEYDDWYYRDVQDTADALDKLLADYDAGKLAGWDL